MKLKPANFGPIMMGKYPFNDCWNSLPKWEQRHRNSPGWCSREKWDDVCECSAKSWLCHTCCYYHTQIWGATDTEDEPQARRTANTWSSCFAPLWPEPKWVTYSCTNPNKIPWNYGIIKDELPYQQHLEWVFIDFPSRMCCWLSCSSWELDSWYDYYLFLQSWEVDKAQSHAPISDFYYFFFGLAPHSLYPVQFTRQSEIVVPPWRCKNTAFSPIVI